MSLTYVLNKAIAGYLNVKHAKYIQIHTLLNISKIS